MMQFYFIRHAQSTNNLLWDRTGSNNDRVEDPPLTDIGWEQARFLAEFLQNGPPEGGNLQDSNKSTGCGITHLYSSLMLRAVETGTTVAETLCLPLIAWEELHEQGGIYLNDKETGKPNGLPGKTRSFFRANFPNFILPPDLDETGWWHGRPYESFELGIVRAQNILTDLMIRHGNSNDKVAVISHGGFYNSFLGVLLNMPIQNEIWFRMNNAALTRIDFLGDEVRIAYMNRMDYLPARLIS
jgi:2,3-bisphosphoglycerate-dependent phosphoglycerate mutase